MKLNNSFLHDRKLWVYYSLFFSGCLVLIYQALGWSALGDSVNFLCLLFLLNGLHVRRIVNIFENALLVTLGYILPLLIRNSLKLSYAEAPSALHFAKLAFVSSATTMALGILFTTLGFALKHLGRWLFKARKGRITTASLSQTENTES